MHLQNCTQVDEVLKVSLTYITYSPTMQIKKSRSDFNSDMAQCHRGSQGTVKEYYITLVYIIHLTKAGKPEPVSLGRTTRC